MNLRDLVLLVFGREQPQERTARAQRVDVAHERAEQLRERIDTLAAEARGYEGLDRK